MRLRALVFLLAAALCAVVVSPVPGHAANYDVSLVDADTGSAFVPKFDPRFKIVPAGNTLRWTNKDVEFHTVTAYYASNPAQPTIASSALSYNHVYTAPYAGGAILYRCQYHSMLDTRVTPPACEGMCGAIHDASQDTRAPHTVRITTQDGFVFTGAVRVDGIAQDDRGVATIRVRIRPVVEVPLLLLTKEGFAQDGDAMNTCSGCYGPSALWTFRSIPAVNRQSPFLNLPPGQYRVEATAFDMQGNAADADPITIYVVR